MDKGYRDSVEGQVLWVRGADGLGKPEGLDTGKATSTKGTAHAKIQRHSGVTERAMVGKVWGKDPKRGG